MAHRRVAFLTIGSIALLLAILCLAVLAQAQQPSPLPAVPGVAVAPPSGRNTASAMDAVPPYHPPHGASLPGLKKAKGPVTLSSATQPPVGGDLQHSPVGQRANNANGLHGPSTAPHISFRANSGGDWVDGDTSADATVWITATDGVGSLKGTATATAQPDGKFSTDLWLDGQRTDLLPGDVISLASSDGTEAGGTLPDIQGQLDAEADTISGQLSGAIPPLVRADLYHRSKDEWFHWDLPIEVDGSFNLYMGGDVDVQNGDYVEVWAYDGAGNWLGTQFFIHYLQVNVQRTHDWVVGEAWPFVTVDVEVRDSDNVYKGSGQTWTGGGTGWKVNLQRPDGKGLDIVTGDTVIVSVPGIVATLPIIGLEAAVDSAADVIGGHLPDAVSYPADLDVEVWDTPDGYGRRIQTDGDGDFSVDLTGDYDVRPGEQIAVWYVRPDGHRIGIVRSELRVYPSVTDDWVGEATTPHTFVEVTVGDGARLDAVKGTASGWSDDEGYFNLQPAQNGVVVDILPGDLVQVTAGGRSAGLAIPEPFSAVYDDVANTMSGQAPPGSLLNVWIDNYPGFWITVPENGEWSVDYNPYGDPQPWDQGHVNYYSDDGHVARLECRIPYPDLRVEKWVEGNNQAAPGGRSVFGLYYRNEGSLDAPTIRLTDTLPANTAYVADSSGVPAATGPGWVAWTLPGLAPGEDRWFQLVLENSAGVGDTLRNQADIWAANDYNTGNNHAESEVYVIDDRPDLYANKNSTPNDPAPGQTFLWEISYGNNRPVPAGPVVLTDTLPPGTSLVSWYSENGYELWQVLHAGNDALVLAAPALPAWWGDRIILQLRVDAGLPPGTQLRNRIEVKAPDDANPDDNWQENDAWVGWPRWDAGVYKSFNWGRLVPGGEASYSIHVRNHGNMAAPMTITDTLPAGTHFADAWAWVGPNYVHFPPDYVDDRVAVWQVGMMEPGAWINIDLYLTIDGDTPPGTDLTNCMAAAVERDGHPFNDTSCVTDAVREPGPNLRLYKSVWWNWEGQLEYEIKLQNVGTESLVGFTVADLYPEGTAWNGDWWVRYGPWMTATHDAPGRRLVFWVERLNPGDTAGIGFRVDLDGGLIGQQGLSFTNAAGAPIAGDVYPADNQAAVTAYTGPDLFAEKWVSGGEPGPGEVLTFTVRTGNANNGPWKMSGGTNLILAEYLPEGMNLLRIVWPDGNPIEPLFYDPDTGLAILNFGELGGDDWRWFYVVVQLDPDWSGAALVNRLEVSEWPAWDIDPNPGNNSFEYVVTLGRHRVFLPVVSKRP